MTQRDRASKAVAREGARTRFAAALSRDEPSKRSQHYRKGRKANLSGARRRLDKHVAAEDYAEASRDPTDPLNFGVFGPGVARSLASQAKARHDASRVRFLDRESPPVKTPSGPKTMLMLWMRVYLRSGEHVDYLLGARDFCAKLLPKRPRAMPVRP